MPKPPHISASMNQSKQLRRYVGKWVAMSLDRQQIFASAPTFEEVLAESQKKSRGEKPVVFRVSDQYAAFLLM